MTIVRYPTLHIIISSTFPFYSGGREVWLYHVLRYLDAAGYPVVVYSLQASNATPIYDLSGLTHVEHMVIPAMHAAWRRLERLSRLLFKLGTNIDYLFMFPRRAAACLKRTVQDGDVVLAMNPVLDLEPGILLRRQGKQFTLACEVHGTVADELSRAVPVTRRYFRNLEKQSLRQADLILANGYDTQDYLAKLGFESRVIPNGADLQPFMNPPHLDDVALYVLRNLRARGFYVIGVVGSLRPIKGTLEALESVAYLETMTTKPFKMVFVGKGDQKTYLQRARALGVDAKVLFVGEQTNLPGFVHYFDLALCPSYGSGMSVAARECMAASKPVVAWDSPVYRQMIRHGESGWLVTEKDPRALAAGIYHAIEHPTDATAWGHSARQASLAFDWSTVTRDLIHALGLDREVTSCG